MVGTLRSIGTANAMAYHASSSTDDGIGGSVGSSIRPTRSVRQASGTGGWGVAGHRGR
jgi:hypothetical protein